MVGSAWIGVSEPTTRQINAIRPLRCREKRKGCGGVGATRLMHRPAIVTNPDENTDQAVFDRPYHNGSGGRSQFPLSIQAHNRPILEGAPIYGCFVP